MTRYEVLFRPIKRRIRGIHQPDVSYVVTAETASRATAWAREMIRHEHQGYMHSKTVELGGAA